MHENTEDWGTIVCSLVNAANAAGRAGSDDMVRALLKLKTIAEQEWKSSLCSD